MCLLRIYITMKLTKTIPKFAICGDFLPPVPFPFPLLPNYPCKCLATSLSHSCLGQSATAHAQIPEHA